MSLISTQKQIIVSEEVYTTFPSDSNPTLLQTQASTKPIRSETNRKRFDSSSTNSSSLESANLDSRFETKPVSEVPQIKKSFLSFPQATPQKDSCGKNNIEIPKPQRPSSSVDSSIYSVTLSITNPSARDEYNCYIYRQLPTVEMSLDDEKPVVSLVYDIIEFLQETFFLNLTSKYSKEQLRLNCQTELLKLNPFGIFHATEAEIEVSEANKKGQPKGCSFDWNQALRDVKCKQKLAVKVFSDSVYHPSLLKLIKKRKKRSKDGILPSTIEVQEDLNSTFSQQRSYKSSQIQHEMEMFREKGRKISNSGVQNTSIIADVKGKIPVLVSPPQLGLSGNQAQKSIFNQSVDDNQHEKTEKPIEIKEIKRKSSFWSRLLQCNTCNQTTVN